MHICVQIVLLTRKTIYKICITVIFLYILKTRMNWRGAIQNTLINIFTYKYIINRILYYVFFSL